MATACLQVAVDHCEPLVKSEDEVA